MTSGIWTRGTVGWLLVAAALPVAVELVLEQGAAGALRLGVGCAVVLFWQALFRLATGAPASPTALVTALTLSFFLPPDTAIWQVAISATFGAIIGELVFGGWGRNFLSPGVVAVAFFALSFPNVSLWASGTGLALAVLPGAILLVVTGILSLPVMVSFAAVLVAGSGGTESLQGVAGTFAFAAVFLVADPVASAATRPGRWIFGALAGGLTALFMTVTEVPRAVVFAALLAGVFAPLIDQVVTGLHVRLRRTRHGKL